MSPALHVARKELREMFRDKRVRSSAFFGPIILIVALMSVFGFIFSQIGDRERTRIHVVQPDHPMVEVLREARFQVEEVPSLAIGERLVREGKARVVLTFTDVGPAQTRVDAYVDPKQQTGQIAVAMVSDVIRAENRRSLEATLEQAGLPPESLEPIQLTRHEVQVGEQGGASEMLVGFLPYLIVIWAFYGGMSVASDLIAGEKEKNTLETLLISPVRRTDIVLGKFLALSVVCLLSSLSSLVGLVLLALVRPPGSDMMFETGLGVTPLAAVLIIALMVPMVAFFASLLVGVSSFAKNSRESQTYLTQISFIVILPAIFSQFIGFTDFASARWVNYVPILNTANNIRMSLLGKPDFVGIGITVAVSLVLALLALWGTVKLFNREEVLVRV